MPAIFNNRLDIISTVALNRFKYRFTRPHVVLSLILILVLTLFVVIPLLKMIHSTSVWQEADTRLSRYAEPGEWTDFHWKRVFNSRLSKTIFYSSFLNSLAVASTFSILALTIGATMAWLVVRTDMPFKKFIESLAVVPYILPSFTLALAWLNVFKNSRIGGAAGFYQYLLGVNPPDWLAYGFVPIVITLSLHYYPYTYLLVSGALVSVDSHLEESGEVLGATRLQILRKITFPLVLPALLSAFILTFSRGLGTFSTPYFLGLPVRYFTLSTMIYSSIVTRTEADGYILALVLIMVSSGVIYLNQRLIGARRSYVTIAGKGFRRHLTKLGKWRYPAFFTMLGVITVSVFLPMALLTWQALMLLPDDYSLSNLTLHYWIGGSNPDYAEGEKGILRNSLILGAAWNSVRLSVLVSVTTGIIGILIGYAIVKGRNTLVSKIVEQESFLPYLIPSISFGAIYLATFVNRIGPLPPLYGTFAVLVLICAAKNLPFAARAGVSSMMQIAGELEEAAVVTGASWRQRFQKIIIPLTLSGTLSGFILVFIAVMRELSLIILLVTPATRTLTTMTFRYIEQGYPQFADAIIVFLVFLILIGEFIARKTGKADWTS